MDKARDKKPVPPDRRPIPETQALRLASLAGLNVKEIAGSTVADLSEKLKWRIDPELLFFRRICGRVVKRDPATGAEYPVPFATVTVQDTDCSFLGYFPVESPWAWLFPIACRREDIATAVTDSCGRFCAFVPRWDVDWVLRFRRERHCYLDLFVRPDIRDLLDKLRPELPRPPIPEPDPPPLLRDGGLTLRRAEEVLGRNLAGKLAALEASGSVGGSTERQQALLRQNAFAQPLPPPLPSEFKQLVQGRAQAAERERAAPVAKMMVDARAAIAGRLNLDVQRLEALDFRRFIGPFRRCVDEIVPEWVPIIDVPDITFKVTQDVDGDGDQETIYAENFFEVRWDAGPMPEVTLEAAQLALAGVACDVPPVACVDAPAISFAGLMPVVNPAPPVDPYHDQATGYARRVNRPHPSGSLVDPLPNPLADAPYGGTLQLYGCNHSPGAAFYRLRYRFNGSAAVPFTGLSWPVYRVVGGVLQTQWVMPDPAGWYPILPDADGWFPNHLLLNWPTGSFQDGHYQVEVQLGNAAKAVVNTSAAVAFRVDNSAPTATFTELRWRVAGGAWSAPLSLICPVITRPASGGVPADIEIRVSYQVAATHLRSVSLGGGGCGGDSPSLLSPASTAQHWHVNAADNSVSGTATFGISGSLAQGAYSFSLFAASRAFNPAGGDAGVAADWNYDPVFSYAVPSLPVAVVNA